MTEPECPRRYSCMAGVCPLEDEIELLVHVEGDPICSFILKYLDGEDVPMADQIKKTRWFWEKEIGEGNLRRKMESRHKAISRFRGGHSPKIATLGGGAI